MGEFGHKITRFSDALETLSMAETRRLGESLGELTAQQRSFAHRTLHDLRIGREIPAQELSLLEYLLEDWERQTLGVKLAFIAQVEHLSSLGPWPDDVLSEHPTINDIMRQAIHANAPSSDCAAPVH